MMWLLLCVTLFPFVSAYEGYHHDAVAILNLLLKADEEVVKLLQKYLYMTKNKHITEVIKRYINTSKIFTEVLDSGSDPFHHPINGFHFLKHLVYNWKDVDSVLKNNSTYSSGPIIRAIMRKKDTYETPTSKAVSYAAASISRMQYFSNLSMKGLVEGKVDNGGKGEVFHSIKGLNSWDCNEVGEGAMVFDQYEKAMEWFNIAKDKVVGGDDSIDIATIMKNEEKAMVRFEVWLSSAKESIDIDTDEFTRKMDDPSFTISILRNDTQIQERMADICQGKTIKPRSPKPYLSCKYFTRDNAFLKLGPLKLEEVSEKPALMVFHNFMMEKEMEKMVKMSEKYLKSSTYVETTEENADRLVLSCTSKHYAFHSFNGFKGVSMLCHKISSNNTDTIYAKISRRIEAALGVEMKRKHIQVKNYGIAGANTPHVDFKIGAHKEIEDKVRDNIANLMVYAGNVTYGGSTVFPLAGVSIPPERGAAVLWFNDFMSGEGDIRSMHSSCPVVYGSKWVINNWIDKEDQMFNLLCASKYLERFGLFR